MRQRAQISWLHWRCYLRRRGSAQRGNLQNIRADNVQRKTSLATYRLFRRRQFEHPIQPMEIGK